MTDWRKTTIGAEVTLQRGFDITRVAQRDGEVPVVSSSGISSYHDTHAVKGPGVVLGRKGVVGSVYFIPTDYWPHDTTLWVRDFHGNEPRFVYYFFKGFARRLALLDVGSANPTLNRNHVHPIPVTWPPLHEQLPIARILGALDEKIELNRRVSETLDATARALFKSWFVNFDPVRARAEGRDPGLPRPVAELFPDRFEESEIGRVPMGWRVSTLGDETVTLLGGTPARAEPAYWGGDIPWINSGKANELRVIQPSEWITLEGLESSATKLLPARTTIVAITGATLGQVSLIEIGTCANQSLVGVLGNDRLPSEYIYFWVRERISDLVAWQTGGAQQHINKNNVNALPVMCPSGAVVAAFKDVARPMFDRIKVALLECLTLAEARDLLIPRLTSGEIRVSEADRRLEAAPA